MASGGICIGSGLHCATHRTMPIFPPERILLGPGPSAVPARVLRALGAPTIGHLDPVYIEIMDSTCARLREVYRTKNALTFPVSATTANVDLVLTALKNLL